MGAVVWLIGVILVMSPFPEYVLWNHVSPLPFLVALGISLGQLGVEYWLMGVAGRNVSGRCSVWWEHSRLRRWWSSFWEQLLPDWLSFRPILAGLLRVGGHAAMFVCSANPIPGTPIARVTAVAIWRASHLRGSFAVILLATLLRLWIVAQGLEGVRVLAR